MKRRFMPANSAPADRGEKAAGIVKRIYDLHVSGKEPVQIAKALAAGRVLTVKPCYAKRDGKPAPDALFAALHQLMVIVPPERMLAPALRYST